MRKHLCARVDHVCDRAYYAANEDGLSCDHLAQRVQVDDLVLT